MKRFLKSGFAPEELIYREDIERIAPIKKSDSRIRKISEEELEEIAFEHDAHEYFTISSLVSNEKITSDGDIAFTIAMFTLGQESKDLCSELERKDDPRIKYMMALAWLLVAEHVFSNETNDVKRLKNYCYLGILNIKGLYEYILQKEDIKTFLSKSSKTFYQYLTEIGLISYLNYIKDHKIYYPSQYRMSNWFKAFLEVEDYSQALSLMQRAHTAESNYYLGYFHFNGLEGHINKNLNIAYHYFQESAKGGNILSLDFIKNEYANPEKINLAEAQFVVAKLLMFKEECIAAGDAQQQLKVDIKKYLQLAFHNGYKDATLFYFERLTDEERDKELTKFYGKHNKVESIDLLIKVVKLLGDLPTTISFTENHVNCLGTVEKAPLCFALASYYHDLSSTTFDDLLIKDYLLDAVGYYLEAAQCVLLHHHVMEVIEKERGWVWNLGLAILRYQNDDIEGVAELLNREYIFNESINQQRYKIKEDNRLFPAFIMIIKDEWINNLLDPKSLYFFIRSNQAYFANNEVEFLNDLFRKRKDISSLISSIMFEANRKDYLKYYAHDIVAPPPLRLSTHALFFYGCKLMSNSTTRIAAINELSFVAKEGNVLAKKMLKLYHDKSRLEKMYKAWANIDEYSLTEQIKIFLEKYRFHFFEGKEFFSKQFTLFNSNNKSFMKGLLNVLKNARSDVLPQVIVNLEEYVQTYNDRYVTNKKEVFKNPYITAVAFLILHFSMNIKQTPELENTPKLR